MDNLRSLRETSIGQIKAPVGSPPAIVVGLGANGLAVTRALHARGIRCIGIGVPEWQPSYTSRSCEVVRCRSWTEKALLEQLAVIANDLQQPAPLIVTKEEAVHWVFGNRERLSKDFLMRWPSAEAFNLMMSKIEFQQLAIEEGWPVPVTLSISDKADLLSRLNDVPYPCILKPAIKSSAYFQNSPAKAFILHSEAELLRHYDLIARWDKEVVIQEWVGGDDHRITYSLAYYDKQSRPRAMFIGRKLRQCPIDCGNTAVAAPAPAEWVGPLAALSKKIFQRLQYQGIGSVEFKMRADGSPVIMEPTIGRTNWQSEIAVLNGVDIPSIAYFDLIGAHQLPVLRNLPPCKLVHGRMHARSLVQQQRAGRLSLDSWLRERRGKKNYMLWRLNDPVPFFAASFRRLIVTFTRVPNKLMRKLRPREA